MTLRRIDIEYGDVAITAQALAGLPTEVARVIVHYDDGLGTAWRLQRDLDRDRRLVREVRLGLHVFDCLNMGSSFLDALLKQETV